MFENLMKFFKKFNKKQEPISNSKEAAKERLHLVLMQDRANVSADFLELMKQEIIEVIKKYIDVDEKAIDVRLTNKENEDGTNGAPALYANIPILNIKNEARKLEKKQQEEKNQNNRREESKSEYENSIKEKKEIEENRKTDDMERQENSKEMEDSNRQQNSEKIENNDQQQNEKKIENNDQQQNIDKKEENNNVEQSGLIKIQEKTVESKEEIKSKNN